MNELDVSIITEAKRLILEDAKTYGSAAQNVKVRLALHTDLEELLRANSTSIEMSMIARDLTDLVAACIVGADKSAILARALADLQKMAPHIAVKEKIEAGTRIMAEGNIIESTRGPVE